MGALFLHPRSALLWNTYNDEMPRSAYSMKPAAAQFEPGLAGPIEQAEGSQADLRHWHATVDPLNRFGLLLINTSGGSDFFSITGGPGGLATCPAESLRSWR